MKKLMPIFIACVLLCSSSLFATGPKKKSYSYNDSWGNAGFNLVSSTTDAAIVTFSVTDFEIIDEEILGQPVQTIMLPGVFLPNNAGAPNIPGTGRYIAMPEGATASLRIISMRTESIKNVNIGPAPEIPLETEDGLKYYFNKSIYSHNAFYPSNPAIISPKTDIRGVDVVTLGITPFQYNPVTKELLVIRDITVEIEFKGGNGHFGEDRLRSRWFDPLLRDMLLNESSLPEVGYTFAPQDSTGDYEYVIITPNNVQFTAWADSIKEWRTAQGIRTGVFTLTDVGGSTTTAIENFINNAYNTWTIPPVAVLLMADYGTNATNSIISPIHNNYCVSDNIYADVNNDNLPDIAIARITAQNETHLSITVGKMLEYERTPPTNANFYNNPITAMGWQTERWFQLCSETINGFFQYGLNKQPVRQNALYSGSPGGVWSTATNTSTVVNYFGPSGLGYIPATSAHLTNWSANASSVNAAINSGAFILQHRDHGGTTGWGEPSYNISSLSGLTNNDYTFVFSVNCLTGKYNSSSTCFAEAFHRYPKRALGLIAASEVSYSFVNDTYVWGLYDNMWPEFLPAYGTPGEPRLMPAFGNTAAKHFLAQSSWPYNTSSKLVTYNLFHHHGGAFTTLFSEIPQYLTVSHNPVLLAGVNYFDVTADSNSLICLTVNGDIIAIADGTGAPVSISITPLLPGIDVIVTVTKQNYYRYSQAVQVIPPVGPYVIQNMMTISDSLGNNNGLADYGEEISLNIELKNVGIADASNVVVTIISNDPFINITDASENYGTITSNSTQQVPNAFSLKVMDSIPDGHNVVIGISATDGNDTWGSSASLVLNAPLFRFISCSIDDPNGNNNGQIDPGETVTVEIEVENAGHADAANAILQLLSTNQYVSFNSGSSTTIPSFVAGNQQVFSFSAVIDTGISIGTNVDFISLVEAGYYTADDIFFMSVGEVDETFETGDFSKYNWVTGGTQGWTVTNSQPYQGTYCAKSGAIPNNSSTYLEITVNVTADDYISFFRSVSSEAGYDYLEFYIDNVKKGQWAGALSWAMETYPVTTGTHTFKWVYDKDYYVTGGSDCGWIDYIQFPPMVVPGSPLSVSTVATSDDICEGESTRMFAVAQGGSGTYTYIWTPTTGLDNSSVFNPIASPAASTTYTIQVNDGQGFTTGQHAINVHPLPIIDFGPADTSICGDDIIILDATIPNGQSWLWSPGNQTTISISIDSSGIGFGTQTFHVLAEDVNGCSTEESITVTFVNCAGIEDNIMIDGINIYPNPNQGSFTVEINKPGINRIAIYNALGETVFEKSLKYSQNSSLNISLSNMPDGIYFLHAEGDKGRLVKKVLIRR